jgi:AmiR/NasT family two-component response regulator
MEPIQDDIEAVRAALLLQPMSEHRDALAALDRLVAERDRLQSEVEELKRELTDRK